MLIKILNLVGVTCLSVSISIACNVGDGHVSVMRNFEDGKSYVALNAGESLYSDNCKYELRLQAEDGNLVEYRHTKNAVDAIASTNLYNNSMLQTSPPEWNPTRLILDKNGALILTGESLKPKPSLGDTWRDGSTQYINYRTKSSFRSVTNAALKIHDNGDIDVYWDTNGIKEPLHLLNSDIGMSNNKKTPTTNFWGHTVDERLGIVFKNALGNEYTFIRKE